MITASIQDTEIIIRTHKYSAVRIIQNGLTYYAKRNANHFSFFDSDDFFNDVLDILGEENHLTFPVSGIDFVDSSLFQDENFNYFQLKISRNVNNEVCFEFGTQDGFFLETFLIVVLNKENKTAFYYDIRRSRDNLFAYEDNFSLDTFSREDLFAFFTHKQDRIIEKANEAFEEHKKNYALDQRAQLLQDIKKRIRRLF